MARAELDFESTVGGLERQGTALAAMARDASAGAWSNHGTLGESIIEAKAALTHAVHDATHHQMDVSRGLVRLGLGTPPQTGSVVQISTSNGGVPKRPVEHAVVTHRGLVGDYQAERKHHGRPFQALCVWSEEVIDELAGLGHGLAPGLAGENLTLSGLDWPSLRPGSRLRVGTVLAEISYPATPCAKQTRWFLNGDFGLIDYDRNPQWVRWYAWVREPGEVACGDPARLQD
jgi:MOSC domain-containing protein YiiM